MRNALIEKRKGFPRALLQIIALALMLSHAFAPLMASAASTVDLLRVAKQYSAKGKLLDGDALSIFPDEGDIQLEVNETSNEDFVSSKVLLVNHSSGLELLLGENVAFTDGVWKTTIPGGSALAEGQYRLELEYTFVEGYKYVYIHGGNHRVESIISEPQRLVSNMILTVHRGAYVEPQDNQQESKPEWDWLTEGSNIYCIIDGKKATGWNLLDNAWYMFAKDGRMLTGWQKDKGKWYYLGKTGMKTGWVYDGGKWYYLGKGGAMRTGWYTMSGCWYYFSGSGAMRTGWIKDKGKWYYMNKYGSMVTGYNMIESQLHKFARSGEWLGESKGYVDGPLL